MIKTTHKEFIIQMKERQSFLYAKLIFLEEYKDANSKILVKDKYGMLMMRPSQLLLGATPTILSAVDKHEYFLNKLKDINIKAYDSLVFIERYNQADKKILAMDEYGLIRIAPTALLSGRCSTIKSAVDKTQYIINRFKEVHGDRYDYSKMLYINNINRVIVVCPEHGEFLQYMSHHLKGHGCPECGRLNKSISNMLSQKDVISNMSTVHDCFYDYSKFIYTGSKEKSIIICPIHGEFLQSYGSHYQGHGCDRCIREDTSNNIKVESWISNSLKSNNFDSYKLYKIKCWNDDELFYKIGITFRKIKERFSSGTIPYSYKIIEIIESDNGVYIWNLEKELHKRHKDDNLQYIPKIKFGGAYECFVKLLND